MQQSVAIKQQADDRAAAHADHARWLDDVAKMQDRQSFASLFEYYAPRLKTYMARLGADPQLAEDLMQETMVKVWNKASTYDATRAVPSAWIYRIARNQRIDRLRRQRYREVEFDFDTMEQPSRHADHIGSDYIDACQLNTYIQDLPGDQLEVVRLAFFDGLSHREICERLDIPLGTVKSRLRLAFGKLRTAMGEY